ncbi:MAG: hypothetical protein P9M00_09040 [Candidatus Tritonobacter lacicola]|nr:hypothetical protein [Candidatus Tritonobacter lacicola]
MKMKYVVIVVACMFFTCSSAEADHWTPPTPTGWAEALYGFLTGFTPTVGVGDEIAAFMVIGDTLVGHDFISESGGNLIYDMFIYAGDTTPFAVYFLVWDGLSEHSATPGFTTNNIAAYPPGGGPTEHNMEQGVPEPPTVLILGLSALLIWLFISKPQLLWNRIAASLESMQK